MKILPWPQLVAAQFVLTVRNRRWMELFAGAAALQAVAMLVGRFAYRLNEGRINADELQLYQLYVWTFGLTVLAVVWPTFLWRDETPTQRRYHWSLPAARGAHDLARVAAGAIWMVILAAIVTAIVAVWLPLVRYRLGSWSAEFTFALLAGYGLASIAALTSDRPTAWIFAAIAFCAAIAGLIIGAGFYPLHGVIPFELVLGRGGLLTLFFHFADRRTVAGPVWLGVAAVGLAFVTLRRSGGFRLSLQRTR